MLTRRVRTLRESGVLTALLLAACVVGCSVTPRHRGPADPTAAADSAPVVYTVAGVMESGDFLSWLDEGLKLTDAGHYKAALPYLEAAVESGQAYGVQKIILYWAAAQVHAELGNEEAEVRYFERFLFATSGYEDEPVFKEVELDRWVRFARARLLSRRVMRGGGYGGSVEHAVLLESVEEELMLVEMLRCGPSEGARYEVSSVDIDVVGHRVIEVLSLSCEQGDGARELYLDLSHHAP